MKSTFVESTFEESANCEGHFQGHTTWFLCSQLSKSLQIVEGTFV
jgi:hypothetical protein